MLTRNEEGLLNNYASEPALYYAQYPSQDEQNQYIRQGAIAVLFVVALFLTALSVG